MVNSSWTKGHVNRLLKPFGWRDDADEPEEEVEPTVVSNGDEETTLRARGGGGKEVVEKVVRTKRFKTATIVYPPCDTISLASLPLSPRENIILSVAQFRSVPPPSPPSGTNLSHTDPRKNITSNYTL
jgi:alpha-1,2-mannosyltransferase